MLGRLCEAEVGRERFENLSHDHIDKQQKSRLSALRQLRVDT